ncbi:mevalonate galactokinase-like protein [Moniliophthora roreri]|nr:mevalonate galactokinase-like protein [Moniliophthora roreri]
MAVVKSPRYAFKRNHDCQRFIVLVQALSTPNRWKKWDKTGRSMGKIIWRGLPACSVYLHLTTMVPQTFVYYCSGHGYGHATRVSAFASHLLRLPLQCRPQVHIVSEAPKHVFSDSIALGAQYRYADWIDPIIVQPVAYRVDRQKSVDVLKAFMKKKDLFVETERTWLTEIGARCVLSDAAFLGCLAAKAAGIPSILVTNFTFDSVYSYLSTAFVDSEPGTQQQLAEVLLPADIPVPQAVLDPLVRQIHEGYRHADLLLLLPGQIPIPSFSIHPLLPSPNWVDLTLHSFNDDVVNAIDPLRLTEAFEREHEELDSDVAAMKSESSRENSLCESRRDTNPALLHPHIPFPSNFPLHVKSASGAIKRKVLRAPLLVRSPTAPGIHVSEKTHSVYTIEGRKRLLSSIGVPEHLHDPEHTKVLVVSFGGQVFRKPSTTPASGRSTPMRGSTTGSPPHSRTKSSSSTAVNPQGEGIGLGLSSVSASLAKLTEHDTAKPHHSEPQTPIESGSPPRYERPHTPLDHRDVNPDPKCHPLKLVNTDRKQDSQSQAMWIPGAPSPAIVHSSKFPSADGDNDDEVQVHIVPATPSSEVDDWDLESSGANNEMLSLLPDDSWIAIVCGVSKEQWERQQQLEGDDGGLPENFFVAPRDVYMPDLTAIADVLLGKLGYGTVADSSSVVYRRTRSKVAVT